MDTRALIKVLKSEFPDLAPIKLVRYLNWAYQQLVNQNSNANLILNRADDVFPYPILWWHVGEIPDPWTRPDDWLTNWDNTDLTKTLYSVVEGNFVNTNQVSENWKIKYNGTEFLVKAREVSNVFTCFTNNTISDMEEFYRPYGVYPGIYNRYYFTKIPFYISDGPQPDINFYGNFTEYTTPIFFEMHYKLPEIESETSPMAIDITRWLQALITGVKLQREDELHGNRNKTQLFEMYKAQYLSEMNGKGQKTSRRTATQVF